jgi:hypothetical protein
LRQRVPFATPCPCVAALAGHCLPRNLALPLVLHLGRGGAPYVAPGVGGSVPGVARPPVYAPGHPGRAGGLGAWLLCVCRIGALA